MSKEAIALIAVFIIPLFFIKIYHFPAISHLMLFIGAQTLHFGRVRNRVMFQLTVYAILFVMIYIRTRGKNRLDYGPFYRFSIALLAFLLVFSVVGFLNGHSVVQIGIDCYKYLDILVIYLLFRISWQGKEDILQGLKSLTFLMLCLGVAEIFLTKRGGVGLNLVMSLFPIVFALSLYQIIPYRKTILVLSTVIVASCQTRTYILGFLVGLALLTALMPKEKRESILSFSFIGGFLGITALSIFGGQVFRSTIQRFGELSSGFTESGGYRIYDYLEAIKRFTEHPLFGHGLGYIKRTFIRMMGWMDWGDFVHCMYLEILFKTGISGSIYLISIVWDVIRWLLNGIREFRNRNDYLFVMCCGCFCAFITWAFVYTFAPPSTLGSMFVGPVIGILALKYNDWEQEVNGSEYV